MPDTAKRSALDVLRDLNTIRKGSMPTGEHTAAAPKPAADSYDDPERDARGTVDMSDPVEQSRVQTLKVRQRKRDAGFSQDIHLHDPKKPTDYLR